MYFLSLCTVGQKFRRGQYRQSYAWRQHHFIETKVFVVMTWRLHRYSFPRSLQQHEHDNDDGDNVEELLYPPQ
jgi:hypothetical protein